MGDRNNPIKFGPEWLRNMARERNAGRANPVQNATRPGASGGSRSSGSQGPGGPGSNSIVSPGAGSSNAATGSPSLGSTGASLPTGPGASAAASSGPPVAGASGTNSRNTNSTQHQKVQLAKLRYGREEMLALYDRNAEAPEELKYFDLLYQPRSKPPVALNTYDEETREARTGAGAERYGVGRGRGAPAEVRVRSRMPFVRHASAVSAGRGATSLHSGIPRMPGYSGGLDEEGSSRPWSSNNSGGPPRTDQGDWTASKMFRRRQANNTNWRQTSRDEGDEWRQENSRAPNRSNADKWDRDWSERPSQERPQSWAPNRRQWAGDSNNDDNLPEWAIDSAEAGAGTFDSSGAFHGYSNDDSNIPKSQESTYPLTRSHTHGGSFVRSKTVEEGSEEWWASEKAKKLSPKRFEAGDSRYKKSLSTGTDEVSSGASTTAKRTGNSEKSGNDLESLESDDTPEPEPDVSNVATDDDKQNDLRQKFSDSKTFDAFMRSDIDFPETSNDKGNFQSVMITPNNGLRQKHQNIVTASSETVINRQQINASGLLQILHGIPLSAQNPENESTMSNEDKLVEGIMDMTLEEGHMRPPNAGLQPSGNTPGIMNQNQLLRIASPALPQHGISMNTGQGIQNVGIPNQALNSSLGLNMTPSNNAMMPMQGLLPPVMNTLNSAMGTAMQARIMGAYQQNAGLPVMPSPNVVNSSIFLGQNNQQQLQGTDMQISTHTAQSNLFPMHGLQHASPGFSSIYGNILPSTNLGGNISANMGANMPSNLSGNINPNIAGNIGNIGNNMGANIGASIGASIGANIGGNIGSNIGGNIAGNIGGNMSSNIVGNIGGNIGASISGNMGSMGTNLNTNLGGNIGSNMADQWYYEDPKKVVQGPFSAKEMYSWYRAGFFSPSLMVRRACETHMRPLGSYGPVVPFAQMEVLPPYPLSGFDSRPQNHEMINPQPALTMEDSLWGQPGTNQDLLWMQQAMPCERNTNLQMFFWDQPPSAISSNSLLPEEIAKEMKTEDQILAQLRASQNPPAPAVPFLNDTPSSSSTALSEESYSNVTNVSSTPDLKQLQKLMVSDKLATQPQEVKAASVEREIKPEKSNKKEQTITTETAVAKTQPTKAESKAVKQTKNDSEKSKNKDNTTKSKKQKAKDDKKDDDNKNKEDDKDKTHDISPTKGKKEEKINKKELEKEKKEWIKEGFTIVKGSEKESKKESKKKLEEAKAAEEAERKKKEVEKTAAEEDKKKKATEPKKQQEHHQRAITETKKAPWSAQQVSQVRDGLPLDEIQRLEREKKLEQIREQQHMVHLMAQEQAAVAAREQVINEMQANNLPWTKKKVERPSNGAGQSFADIQAETRRQATAAVHLHSVAVEDTNATISQVPWANAHNGGGFWDTQPNTSKAADKAQEAARLDTRKKKQAPVPVTPKKEDTPVSEFDSWSTTALASWSASIDVPTFVGFLKDIESPYEVKDYVKCYLGETKESSDFARQFLERRSKLLRVGMVTPSDDLCSPAMAINPRGVLDFADGKGKKSKKNKMLKVDARILGFSVTASEDRINVGDIDSV